MMWNYFANLLKEKNVNFQSNIHSKVEVAVSTENKGKRDKKERKKE
jgi:hypothetical protein